MKYIRDNSVVSAYRSNRRTTTNKFWGLIGILSTVDSTVEPSKSLRFNTAALSNFLESIFALREDKRTYSNNTIWTAIFSTHWIEKASELFLNSTPNVYDVLTWYFRNTSFQDTDNASSLLKLFLESIHLSLADAKELFDFSPRNIEFSTGRYKEEDLFKMLGVTDTYGNRNLTAEGSTVAAYPGELTRAPFIQTLYAAQGTAKCLLITTFDFNEYYPNIHGNEQCDTTNGNASSSVKEKQVIYYGAPGTGKSFNIDKELTDAHVPDEQVKRVIFYPDYTYSDFIGGLCPITNDEGKPEYRFIAGPFTEILKDAFDNSDTPYYVVIEEINRGNPAAIFGDVFQLLDRDSVGKSKYTITNSDVAAYLRGEDESKFANDRIWLPSNLNIVCTMNTADQNVFVLDTAFKRRFAMEYVPIDFTKLDAEEVKAYNDETEVFAGAKTIKEVFQNTDLGGYVTAHEGSIKRNWPTFAQLVNEKINLINRSGDSISEDKKLGPFFVTLDEIQDRQKFADKVLYYLKQDVFKYTDTVLVPSYQKLYSDFVNGGVDLFELFASVE